VNGEVWLGTDIIFFHEGCKICCKENREHEAGENAASAFYQPGAVFGLKKLS